MQKHLETKMAAFVFILQNKSIKVLLWHCTKIKILLLALVSKVFNWYLTSLTTTTTTNTFTFTTTTTTTVCVVYLHHTVQMHSPHKPKKHQIYCQSGETTLVRVHMDISDFGLNLYRTSTDHVIKYVMNIILIMQNKDVTPLVQGCPCTMD